MPSLLPFFLPIPFNKLLCIIICTMNLTLFSPFQIRLIHKSDYTLEERLMFKPIVFANTIQSMSIILHAVERLGNYQVGVSSLRVTID